MIICVNISALPVCPTDFYATLACTHLHLPWVLFQRPALYGTMAGLSCRLARPWFRTWYHSWCCDTVPMQKWVDPSWKAGSNPSMVASSVPVLGTSQLRHRSKVWSVKTLKSRSVKTLKSHDRPGVAWPCWVLPWMAVIDGCNTACHEWHDRPGVAWPCWVLPWMAVINSCNAACSEWQ